MTPVSTAPRFGAGRFAQSVLDLALPAFCAGCGREGEPLCRRCRSPLESRLRLPPGLALGLPANLPMPLAQLEWCSPFSGTVRKALHRLKYDGEKRLAAPLGEALAARWRAAGRGGDLLVPVPVHASRARQRGYDQAVLLASAAAPLLGLPWRRLIERKEATRPQFELGRKARWANVGGAFGLAKGVAAPQLEGAWIVLVDDVVTTGATLLACSEALYAAGAVAVSAVTVARER